MDEIVNLLNEAMQSGAMLFGHCIGNFERKYYAKNHWRLIIDTLGYTDAQYETFDYSDRDICGKDGGFIKRLVENDKIDTNNKITIMANVENQKNGLGYSHTFEGVESLLMVLAISDTPIDDLISYLK